MLLLTTRVVLASVLMDQVLWSYSSLLLNCTLFTSTSTTLHTFSMVFPNYKSTRTLPSTLTPKWTLNTIFSYQSIEHVISPFSTWWLECNHVVWMGWCMVMSVWVSAQPTLILMCIGMVGSHAEHAQWNIIL